ncbi:MAG: hypothetical protein HYX53_14605 [Chloroflexi bacterium]|nr:hypothetical protein [Chloroflexota bacterium]
MVRIRILVTVVAAGAALVACGGGGGATPAATAGSQGTVAEAASVAGSPTATDQPPGPAPQFPSPQAQLDKGAIITRLPLPRDSMILPQTNGADLVFSTRSAAADVTGAFDAFFAKEGWEKVAPVTGTANANARWRREGFQAVLEAGARDAAGSGTFLMFLGPFTP